MSVVENFYRPFDDFSVSVKNWEISDTGITFLWGPSGSGKSTIIKGLLGLDEKARVKWFFRNQEISRMAPSKRNLGVVFQDLGLFPHINARDNILFPVNKKIHKHWKEDFSHLVESLELQPLLPRSVQKLSGGERQRVAIARTLIYKPKMLLLDEPFSSLDERIKKRAQNLLEEFCKTHNCPALLVTHDLSDLKAFHPVSDRFFDRGVKPPTTAPGQKAEIVRHQNRKKTGHSMTNNQKGKLINKVTQIKKGQILWEGSVDRFIQRIQSSRNR